MTAGRALRGVCVISLTPFTDTGDVDTASLQRLIDFYLDAGVHGVTLLGIMGEVSKLTEQERDQVVETAVERVAGRVPVIVGCTAAGTRQAAAFVRRAAALGADAVMVAPPAKVQQPGLLIEHYRTVGEAAPLALVIQDEPVTSGVVLSPSVIGQIANAVPTARYVKIEEAPTIMKVTAIREATQDRLGLFGGLGGMYFYEELARGAVGIMTGFAYPDLLVRVYEQFAAGDHDAARELFYHGLPLVRYEAQLGVTGVAIRKQIYRMRGAVASAYVRPPAAGVDERTLAELADLVKFLKLS